MTHHQRDPEQLPTDYLWDRSGAPDPEIERLESVLGEFRHDGAAIPTFPASTSRTSLAWLPRFAAAATILLALGVGSFFSLRLTGRRESGPAWNVASLEGVPRIGSRSIATGGSADKLYVGQTLSTNSSSRATLSDSELGQIQIDPDSRVRLLQIDPDHKRLQLQLGTIHASIWAPPGEFTVDTPSATAIDLGCAYTLHVAPDGSGTIRTTVGWVGFRLNGRESFIPAGAMCRTRPKLGPGTPYFEDATPAFRDALRTYDESGQSSEAAAAALRTVLTEARARDALTLWHLLSRSSAADREKVYKRLAELVPPPPGVRRGAVLQLEPQALDLYWNAFDLGDISLWRLYEQSSPSGNVSR